MRKKMTGILEWLTGGPKVDARELVQKGALLLDVRTREEYAQRHIPGAVNVPVQELAQRVAEVGSKTRTVVVYCRSGQRSGVARDLLLRAGFQDVVNLGSINNW
ncbi:MAG: rhodanese-like domain-containing protein [Myxococcota bacterium]